MDPATITLGLGIVNQLLQAASGLSIKLAAGSATEADIDEALGKVGVSRQGLVDAIAKAKAEGR